MADEGEQEQRQPLNQPIGGEPEIEEKFDFKMISEELKEEIEECFDIFDKDKDGQINYVELGTLLRWLKFNPTEREMKEFATEFDPMSTNLVNKRTVMKIVDRKYAYEMWGGLRLVFE